MSANNPISNHIRIFFRCVATTRGVITLALIGTALALPWLAGYLTAITSMTRSELGLYALIGALLWLLGFGIEVIADRQKSAFRADPQNADKATRSGGISPA